MLLNESLESKSACIFSSERGQPCRVVSVGHVHKIVREALQMPTKFVIYSLRHTHGPGFGEAGANEVTIAQLMGHSAVTVSQWDVHPNPRDLECAVEELQAMDKKEAARSVPWAHCYNFR